MPKRLAIVTMVSTMSACCYWVCSYVTSLPLPNSYHRKCKLMCRESRITTRKSNDTVGRSSSGRSVNAFALIELLVVAAIIQDAVLEVVPIINDQLVVEPDPHAVVALGREAITFGESSIGVQSSRLEIKTAPLALAEQCGYHEKHTKHSVCFG